MKTAKKTMAFILALIILLSAVSCSESTANSADDTSSTGSAEIESTAGEAVEEAAPEEAKMLPDLDPTLNFDGAEVRIMEHPVGAGDWSDWGSRDLYAESLTGEPINDAVFERNTYVEDTLKVKLNILEVADMPGTIQKQSAAGTGDYHISTARIQSLPGTVMGGYLMNLHDIPNMDLTKPWYDSKCIEEASLYDLLFYVTGSMIILDDDSTGAMVFNKQLITDHNLENPYTLVAEGTWTLDKMEALADVVDSDLNGNGKVDIEGDRFGILWQNDAIISYMHGGGSKIVEKNADGEPEFIFNSENTINLMDKLDEFMFRPELVQNMHKHNGIYSDIYAGECAIFKANNALFMWLRMRVAENLRDMEADFGIIPVPKLTESQSQYYSTVTKYTAGTVCIPNDASLDMELTGAIVELMSAEGHYGLREAYYETNLGTKISRDPESTEMLDIIMENRVYDTGEIYSIGGFADKLYTLASGSKIGVATLIKQNEKSVSKLLEKSFITPMQKLADRIKGQE